MMPVKNFFTGRMPFFHIDNAGSLHTLDADHNALERRYAGTEIQAVSQAVKEGFHPRHGACVAFIAKRAMRTAVFSGCAHDRTAGKAVYIRHMHRVKNMLQFQL